jgi:hypothetical protein
MNKSITPLGDSALEILRVQAENLHYLMNQSYQAIERVKELANKFEQEPNDEMLNYHLAAARIHNALNGNN